MPQDTIAIAQLIKNQQAAPDTYNDSNDFWIGVLVVIGIAWIFSRIARNRGYFAKPVGLHNLQDAPVEVEEEPVLQPLVYKGSELKFATEVIHTVLAKYFPFYIGLSAVDQLKFRERLQNFIESKIFFIHDSRGFREMPILLAATAIKLSFGLKAYLLPYYQFVHIFPEEFVGTVPSLRVLAGNVSGNSIYVSWKHFLEGFQYPDDGQNLGLHEMAHAYYFQFMEIGDGNAHQFTGHFDQFNFYGNQVFESNKQKHGGLYSDYGLKNFQEFWAESVELFFEKPAQLQLVYPDLYASVVTVLNQDPLEKRSHNKS